MELKILAEKNNELFRRKEIKATLDAPITPSREKILELLSRHFSLAPENIKIKGIRGSFGTKSFIIEANLYESPQEKNIVEIKKKKEEAMEKAKAEAKKAAEAPAPEEKPEVKEETKTDVTQEETQKQQEEKPAE